MGVKDFYKYIKARWPECFIPVQYEQLKYQRIAIDMMNVLYVFRARNDHLWMSLVLHFLIRLRKAYVHPVCVFDGPQTHPLKQATVDKRREDREKGRQRVEQLRAAVDHFEQTGECNAYLETFLDAHVDCVSALTRKPIVSVLRQHVLRLHRAYSLGFRHDEVQVVQQLLRVLGFCVIQAEHDGEALCAYLSARGAVDVVLSNDSDVFFFGATRVLFRFTDDGAYQIHAEMLFERMGLTRAQFIELCLLCGTDFNTSIRGVGFCRAYALVQQFSRLDQADFPYTLDHGLLQDVRAFTDVSRGDAYLSQVHYSRPPLDADTELIARLCFQHHVDVGLEELLRWPLTPIEFDESV